MASISIWIKGFKIDLPKYYQHYGLGKITSIEQLYDLPDGWKDREPGEVIVVSRDYDSIDLDDYGVYVAFSYFDPEKNSTAISTCQFTDLAAVLNAKLPSVVMMPYYVSSPTEVFLDHYDVDRGLMSV